MIVYPVYVFNYQWPISLVAMAILNLKNKRNCLNDNSFKPLRQYDSNLIQMLLGLGQFKMIKIMVICLLVWLLWQQKVQLE